MGITRPFQVRLGVCTVQACLPFVIGFSKRPHTTCRVPAHFLPYDSHVAKMRPTLPFWRQVGHIQSHQTCHKLTLDRLYFTTFPHPPPNPQILNEVSMEPGNAPRVRARPRGGPLASPDDDATYYYFTIDDHLLYLSFFQDWGPLNLAMVYKSCILIHELLEVCPLSVVFNDSGH